MKEKAKFGRTEWLLLALFVIFIAATALVAAKRMDVHTPGEQSYTVTTQREAESQLPENVMVNINTADMEALTTLDGIGQTLAKRIIAYRTEHGSFETVEELCEVKGIGERVLAANRERLCVEGGAA
ncbi:MAG: helix-hairpin-helix domain-containing protein [Oscillospiraceae bacterium]|nr:helix-hairpin-helix domain-containing protein [Oscillospiraceae bacterium]